MEHYEHYEKCESFKPRNEEKERIEEDKENLERFLEKVDKQMLNLYKQADNLRMELWDLHEEIGKIRTLARKIHNEEKLRGNVHKDCKYYIEEDDACLNYAMLGVGYNVSRFDKCVDDL